MVQTIILIFKFAIAAGRAALHWVVKDILVVSQMVPVAPDIVQERSAWPDASICRELCLNEAVLR
jgi:hypothetical protein